MRRKFWLPIIGLVFAAVAAMPVAQATEKTYFCFGHRATIVGTPGSDLIYGTTGADVIHGRGSSDLIHGRNGNDIICGGRGGDQHAIRPENHDGHYGLIGGNGNDIVRGGAGDDSIQGGDPLQNPYYGRPEPDPSETDVLYGGGGDDQMLDGGQLQDHWHDFPGAPDTGEDSMYGGAGDDKLYTSGGFNYMNGGADFDICDDDDDDHQELCEAVDTD